MFLRFEAVRSAFHVWVNGHAVGYAQDSFTPKVHRQDITSDSSDILTTVRHLGVQSRFMPQGYWKCPLRESVSLVGWVVPRGSGSCGFSRERESA